jgi:predicted DNA-binding protein
MRTKSDTTTLKLEKETKERLEKLREHKRETYDDIIRKILYVLNTVRDEPIKARAILEFIDEKRKRMFETEKDLKKENEQKNKIERKEKK